MSEAPERIWADQDDLTWVEAYPSEQMKREETEYTRSDLCVTRADIDAAVALALEGAVASVRQLILTQTFGQRGDVPLNNALTAIRALIQPHQADALARVRQEAHNAAREVKPLVWTHYAADETYPEAWCADCCGGFYTVLRDGESSHRWITPNGVEHDDDLESAAEAKAAAQADYTARILAALALPVDGGAQV